MKPENILSQLKSLVPNLINLLFKKYTLLKSLISSSDIFHRTVSSLYTCCRSLFKLIYIKMSDRSKYILQLARGSCSKGKYYVNYCNNIFLNK